MAEETLHPAARRHLEGRFLAGPHPSECHTYHFESEPREEDPDEVTGAFYMEREEVRTHALLCLDTFVSLVERSLYLIPEGADGAAEYRREAGEMFGFINLPIKDGGVLAPDAKRSPTESSEEG